MVVSLTKLHDHGSRSDAVLDSDAIVHITDYIPLGCLRVERAETSIAAAVWCEQSSWCFLFAPRTRYYQNHRILESGICTKLHEALLTSRSILPYAHLHRNRHVCFAFRSQNQDTGTVRVFVSQGIYKRNDLPKRLTEKSLPALIQDLDVSDLTWNGTWTHEQSCIQLCNSFASLELEQPSLFEVFNSLSSPNPAPCKVKDAHARVAMEELLHGSTEGILSKMYDYQRRSAALMLQREEHPETLQDPRFKKLIDRMGHTAYYNPFTGVCLRQPAVFDSVRGGVCAETMGLGKTFIVLRLIVVTKHIPSRIPSEYSVLPEVYREKPATLLETAANIIGKRSIPW